MSVEIGSRKFESSEWENIPGIIPAALTHLSFLLRSVQEWARNKDAEEPVASILLKICRLEALVEEKAGEATRTVAREREQFSAQLERLNNELAQLKKPTHLAEVGAQTELTGHAMCQASDISEGEHSEGEDAQYLDGQTDSSRPRMYSLDTIKKLVLKHLDQSQLKSEVLEQQRESLPLVHSKVAEQRRDLNATVGEFKLEISRVYEKFDFYHEHIRKLYSEVESKLQTIAKWSEKVDSKFTESDINIKDLKHQQEDSTENLDSLRENMKNLEDKILGTAKENNENTKKKLAILQKLYEKGANTLADEVSRLSTDCASELRKTVELLRTERYSALHSHSEEFSLSLKELTTELEQQIYDYRRIHESDLESHSLDYSTFKSQVLEFSKKSQSESRRLKNDFDRWVSTVLEPAHISEARVFTLEAKIKEEENARMELLCFTKDVIRKLIFSLEQLQMTARRPDSEQTDVLFLKRLAFLKKVLELNEDRRKRDIKSSQAVRTDTFALSLQNRLVGTSHLTLRNQ